MKVYVRNLGGTPIIVDARETLSANRTYFVRADGSDANDGLTDSASGAFLTIQKAIDATAALDTRLFNVTIQIADGTYNGNLTLKDPVGAGFVTILGNVGTPANVNLTTASGFLITAIDSRRYTLDGLKLSTTGSGTHLLLATNSSVVLVGRINYAGAAGGGVNLLSFRGSGIAVINNYTISGASGGHFSVSQTAWIEDVGHTVTITGTPAINVFAVARRGAAILSFNNTFSGAATGTRFLISSGGSIDTNGSGVNYFPGNVAGVGGTTAGGGFYA